MRKLLKMLREEYAHECYSAMLAAEGKPSKVRFAWGLGKELLLRWWCQWRGHDLEDMNADPENGCSELYCHRCGWSCDVQW